MCELDDCFALRRYIVEVRMSMVFVDVAESVVPYPLENKQPPRNGNLRRRNSIWTHGGMESRTNDGDFASLAGVHYTIVTASYSAVMVEVPDILGMSMVFADVRRNPCSLPHACIHDDDTAT